MLAQDRSYCDWLAAQPWFREQYQNVYTLIINNFTEPNETPEHNQMQVRFLDEDWQKNVAFLVCPDRPSTVEWILSLVEKPDAERYCLVPCENGSYRVWSRYYDGSWRPHQDGCHHSYVHATYAGFFEVSSATFEVEGTDVVFEMWDGSHLTDIIARRDGSFSQILNIEIKPQLGDDFPAVLRQIKRQRTKEVSRSVHNPSGNGYHTERVVETRPGKWVLLIRDYRGSVPYEKVCDFMASEHIHLVRESDVQDVKLPEEIEISAHTIAKQTDLPIRMETELQAVNEKKACKVLA